MDEVDYARCRLVGVHFCADVTFVTSVSDERVGILLHYETEALNFTIAVFNESFEIDLSTFGVDPTVDDVLHYVMATEEHPSLVVCERDSFMRDFDVDGCRFRLDVR